MRERDDRAAEQDADLDQDLLLQLRQVGANVQMADHLAVIGDGVDEVQRRQAVEAMLVRTALDRLLLPRLNRVSSPAFVEMSSVLLPA